MKRSDFNAMIERKAVVSQFTEKLEALGEVFKYELTSCKDIKVLRSRMADVNNHLCRAIECFMSEDDV